MSVRAAKDIKPGEEVTISYQGRAQLQPVKARRAALQQDFGFSCSCPRCTEELLFEEKVPLESDLTDIASDVDSMRQQFESAKAEGDQEEVEALHDKLRAHAASLAVHFR